MSRGLHRFAVLVACATFLLIIAGALVTSNGAGLAAPDWPLSWGRVFPPMVGNLFYEHGHRLIATSVGLLTIALNIYLWKSESRRWVRRLGLVALGAVIAQGLLGGLTVLFFLPVPISAAHATLAQAFFCTVVSLAVFTAPTWREPRATIEEKGSPQFRYLCVAAVAAIFVQLVIGATLRHSAAWDEHLPTSLLLTHIAGALLVTFMLGSVLTAVFRHYSDEQYLTRPAMIAAALVFVQLFLGLAAYVVRTASPNEPQPLKPMVTITVAHVACGALILATTLVLTLRAFRLLRGERESYFWIFTKGKATAES